MTESYPAGTRDIDVLARTIYGEARGEGMPGRIAVAWTVRNRAARALDQRHETGRSHILFGDGGLASACTMPWQYSCWIKTDPNCARLERLTLPGALEDGVFQDCLLAALLVVRGIEPDPTMGSTHYHAFSVAPSWARSLVPVCTIGRHKFYNNVP